MKVFIGEREVPDEELTQILCEEQPALYQDMTAHIGTSHTAAAYIEHLVRNSTGLTVDFIRLVNKVALYLERKQGGNENGA